ncbi:hypothetical protein FIBSPDRAFT_894567 [Athelia psychrophila]|uniref:Uncharacterized protein n=1 Tax=Athelia psychrophila TaxID=1759441 RepID=A0A166FMW4_9AGAM|nr:hypothetical protein FIBSPDRAFT_894567 [Fibularhizoctonia sp. CBS 109695]
MEWNGIIDMVACGGGQLVTAVLLSTRFMLSGEVLASAYVPFSAIPPIPTGQVTETVKVDIIGQHPKKSQWVEIERQTGTRDIRCTSDLQFSALGASGNIFGLGSDKHHSDNKSYRIGLDPLRETIDKPPAILSWVFTNTHSMYSPMCMKLLVLVEKPTPNPTWFPFSLRLDENMKIEVHNASALSVGCRRLVGKPPGDWRFKIEGRYKQEDTKKALSDAEEHNPPTIVGLDATVKSWKNTCK